MWFIVRHHLYDLVDDGLEDQVDDLQSFLQTQGKDPALAKLREEVNETYTIEHQGNYLEVSSENGDLIYRSTFLQAHSLMLPASDRVGRATFRNRRIEGKPFRFLLEKVSVNGHIYTVEMGVPSNDVVETLSLFRTYLLMFAPVVLLLAAGGGYWLSRRALAPVDELVRTAREVGGANLNSRLQRLETGDELQRLSDTLNEMLDRIERSFSRVTQFTADASHELRTPISLIRTEAELALRRSRGETEYKESLRHILLEAERTTALIEQLLALARADSGRETLHMQPVDLRATLRSVVQGWEQVATIRNLQFSANLDSTSIDSTNTDSTNTDSTSINHKDLCVLGDEAALRRLVDILLDNAFKYTQSPGSVHLSLEQKGESTVITVQDSGMGIAEKDQPKIFERFYRVDEARSRAQGGAGLGLAIAQWIVTQHRGSIGVQSHLGAGAVFRVELPMTATPAQNPQPV
jgi:signal transduction histidine kinase